MTETKHNGTPNKVEEKKFPQSDTTSTVYTKPSPFHSNLTRVWKNETDGIYQKYKVIDYLGSGSMGSIQLVQKMDTAIGGSAYVSQSKIKVLGVPVVAGKKHITPMDQRCKERCNFDYLFALKTIQLHRISPSYREELKNEIDILRTLDHPHIIKAYEVYETRKQIYIILELCNGGDLFTRSPYNPQQAQSITQQIVNAVRYMHEHNVIHRDLKYENILFENPSEEACVKIIDFGLSKKVRLDVDAQTFHMTEMVGTLYTMAPQVLQGVYSSQADMWSVGVISYMLISGQKPFHNKKRKYMIDQIMRGKYALNTNPIWQMIDPSAIDFVRNLLLVDPNLRMTALEASHHKYITQTVLTHDEKSTEILANHSIDEALRHYRDTSSIKKLALNVIAHKSSTADIFDLRQVFDLFDKEKNGLLSYDEFRYALEQTGKYTSDDIGEMFCSIDVGKNGYIMYTEFLAATLEAHGYITEDRIAEAFDKLDSDDSGYITKKNLIQALGSEHSMQEIKQIIKEADYDRDGKISYAEFLQHFRETKYSQISKLTSNENKVDTDDEDDSELLGIDAEIPGGMRRTQSSHF